jgi:hypothetical protein
LIKIISNIIDPVSKAQITSFVMDNKHRKFYVGDAAGGIRQYNMSNGLYIKTVQEPISRIHHKDPNFQ